MIKTKLKELLDKIINLFCSICNYILCKLSLKLKRTVSNNQSITGKEAHEVFIALKQNKNTSELVEKLQAFENYIQLLCKQICPKGLKEAFIYQWVFTNEVKNKRDDESYCKANIFAAQSSLNRIITKINEVGMNEVSHRMVSDFVCDLKPFIQYLDKSQDYTWLLINTNSHISNFYFDLSSNVFWNGMPSKHPEERLVLASSTPFIIRQSIEYKIKRILGIDYFLIDGKQDIRTAEKCFHAIDSNKPFYKTKGFDFKIVKQIYSWTNYYVHGGYRPEPWRTETANNYLKGLFYAGVTSVKYSLSLYAGIEVLESDLDKLRTNTEKNIKNGVQGKVDIEWLTQPEVAIIKKR